MNSKQSHPKFVGSVSLWRYLENERNYPGWHLSADSPGVTSLLSVRAALKASGGHRTIPITPPTQSTLSVPNNKFGKAKWIAPARWRLDYLNTDEDADAWSFYLEREAAILSLGSNRMLELIAGIANIAQSVGDCSIGPSNNSAESLWFWWRIE